MPAVVRTSRSAVVAFRVAYHSSVSMGDQRPPSSSLFMAGGH
ncbi:MAG: hypothetical protein JWL99_4039 [Streptomyces oryziradicis]|jgi:hypothetical protein|nr:hypothetical protein [Actinacidiphila oryziradicis]